MDKKYTWYKIADSISELPLEPNGLMEIVVNSKTICIARQADRLYACAQKCPHAGGHMAQGYINASGNIVCPLHRYTFSLQNGRNTSGEGYFLHTFPVEIRNDGIFVGIPGNTLFGWLK